MPPDRIAVVLVDDHPTILAGLEAAIRDSVDLALTGTARSLDAAISLLQAT